MFTALRDSDMPNVVKTFRGIMKDKQQRAGDRLRAAELLAHHCIGVPEKMLTVTDIAEMKAILSEIKAGGFNGKTSEYAGMLAARIEKVEENASN